MVQASTLIAAAIVSVALAGCAPATHEPRPNEDFATPADNARTVHATGAFSLRIPHDVRQVPVQGIDSAVDQFEGPGYKLLFDYGGFSCGLPDPVPGQSSETVEIDGRTATLVRFRDADPERPVKLTAVFTGLGATREHPVCLTAHAECTDDAACDGARSVFSTIDFD
jgi:hypothetical protein